MYASKIPADFVRRFERLGATVNISNLGSLFPEDDERFMYEGGIHRIRIVDDRLEVEFEWLAARYPDGTWRMVTDRSLYTLRHSIALFQSGSEPDRGLFVFLPMEPFVHETIMFIAPDYVGPTGRTPLKLDEVLK